MPPAPHLARRALAMPASPIRRLAPFAAEARAAGKTVYGLNIGQPDIPTPDAVLERIRAFDGSNVAYGPSEGLPEFLDALHAYYEGVGLPLDRGEIFVTTGGAFGTRTLTYLIFQRVLESQNVGLGSAGGVYAIILANIVAIFLMRIVGKNLDA